MRHIHCREKESEATQTNKSANNDIKAFRVDVFAV